MLTRDLTGHLLVATPSLTEGVFERAVILVLSHTDDGAQGVVLNKPVDATVDTVLDGWQEHIAAPQVLFQGGPVGLDSALGVASIPGEAGDVPGAQRLFGSIRVIDLDAPAEPVVEAASGVRIFAGYAGWIGGQLDGEVHEGTWYVVDLEPSDLLTDEPELLWRQVMRRQPGRLAMVGFFPDDEDFN